MNIRGSRFIRRMKTLAMRLKWARESAGISRRQLCKLAKLSTAHVAFIERGELKNPRVPTVAELAQALGVSLPWLLLGQKPCPDAATIRDHVQRLLSRPGKLQPTADEPARKRAAGA
jgi:transcriptional regulator with XRE-family HTH domain